MHPQHPSWRALRAAGALGAASLLPFVTLAAQAPAPSGAGTRPAAATPSAAARQMTPADLKAWRTIRNPTLSADGKWFAYVLAPNEGDAHVVIRGTAEGAQERRFAIGAPPAAAAPPPAPPPALGAAAGAPASAGALWSAIQLGASPLKAKRRMRSNSFFSPVARFTRATLVDVGRRARRARRASACVG